jgi:hypothetical protein
MATLSGFNAAEVSPESDFDPVPNGDYEVVIIDSENKQTKAGTGEYLQLTLEVVSGHYKGRKIWDRLNLWNQNQTAVDIANRALSQICHAVGKLTPQDSSELHGKPLMARVVVKQSDGYDPSNEVKKYFKIGEQPDGPAPEPVAAANGPKVNRPNWG